jgi:hypothetical protein
MSRNEPVAELDARYGSADAPTSWAEALRRFEEADVYWVVTVRPGPEGGPHVTPLFGAVVDARSTSSPGRPSRRRATWRATRAARC